MKLSKNSNEWNLPIGHETELLDVFKDKLSNDLDICLDIGANVGSWSLNLYNKFTNILAFEPNKAARITFEENIKLNNITNIELFDYALSDKIAISKMRIYEAAGHSTLCDDHPMADTTSEYIDTVDVSTTTLKNIFNNTYENRKIDFIKIDTEGFEIPIIQGGLELIKEHKPKMMIEIHAQSDIDVIRELLPDFDFEEYQWGIQTHLLLY